MPLVTLQKLARMSPLFRGRVGRLAGKNLMRLLAIDRVNALYDRHCHLSGPAFASSVLKDLGIRYTAFAETPDVLNQLGQLQQHAPFITISNHPYGSIDGIILTDYFGHLVPGYRLMTNSMPGRVESFATSLIPVTPTDGTHHTPTAASILGIRHALDHLRAGHPLGLFPAGAVSHLSLRDRCIRDREWQPAVIRLIAKARMPILPVRFFDGNSPLYYLLGLIDWRVRLLRLPAEVFNKIGCPTRLSIAPLISVEEQQAFLATHSLEDYGLWLRSKVYGMTMGM